MGRLLPTTLVLVALACTTATPPRAAPPQAVLARPRSPSAASQPVAPAAPALPPSGSSQLVPSHQGPRPLTVELSGNPDGRFRAALRRLNQLAQHRVQRVRLSVWGDSHVAGAVLVARLRKQLQQQLGHGGPGFAYLGHPWRSYRHLQLELGERGRWRAERLWSRYTRRHPEPRDDLFGLGGISVHTRRGGRLWLAPRRKQPDLAHAELYVLRQPGGGRIAIYADGKLLRSVMTVASTKEAGFASLKLPRGTRRLELRASRSGEVRLYGVDLSSGQPGVVVDAFGINGARASSVLRWNEALMAIQLTHLAPDLLLLAYGSNEVDADNISPAALATRLHQVLQRLRRAAPGAGCLLLGPPDQARFSRESGRWEVPARLDAIVTVQRRMAMQHGCAFWDQRAAMGGPGSIFSWVQADPPLAHGDHVHLYGRGYRALSDELYRALERARLRQACADEPDGKGCAPAVSLAR